MFARANPSSIRLQRILAQYDEQFERDPVALSSLLIKEQEIWRLFVDGLRQHESWLPFEKEEPGYLAAMYSAYPLILSKADVTLDFIKQLHKTALTNVSNTKYEGCSSAIGEVRTQQKPNSIFGVFVQNTSREGLREYFANRCKEEQYLSIAIRVNVHDQSELVGFSLQDKSVRAFRVISGELTREEEPGKDKLVLIFSALGQLSDPIYQHFKNLPDNIKQQFINFIKDVSLTKTDDDFIELVVNAYSNPTNLLSFYFCSKQSEKTHETLTDRMNRFIVDFYSKMQTLHDPLEKLDNIIFFIRRCEQLHPFSDGNCRVFCMLLLNHLLIQYGFPLVILEDPNRFDGFSLYELRQEVLKGMENTFFLLNNKRLYGVSTKLILNLFTEKNRQDLLSNFDVLDRLLQPLTNDNTLMKK
jgi:hypothetical protein